MDIPAHTRPVPPGWTETVIAAEDSLGEAVLPTVSAVATISETCSQLSDHQLAEARYYGFGEMCRYLFRIMQQPKMHTKIITDTRDVLVCQAKGYGATGVSLNLLQTCDTRTLFMPLATQASLQMPLAHRLAADALSSHVQGRMMAKSLAQFSPLSQHIAAYRAQARDPRSHANILYGNLTAERLAGTVFAGGIQIFTTLLAKRADLLCDTAPRAIDLYPAVKDIFTHDELVGLDLAHLALGGAGLRMDDFDANVSNYMHVNPNGTAYLIERRIPKPAELPPAKVLLHQVPLKCPALYVKDMKKVPEARGFIPFIMEMIPNIIIAADDQIGRV